MSNKALSVAFLLIVALPAAYNWEDENNEMVNRAVQRTQHENAIDADCRADC